MCFFVSHFGTFSDYFIGIPSSCRLEVLVRYRGTIPLLDAEAFGSQKQCTKQANADTNEEHWPQDTVQYLHLITFHTRSVCECLIRGFGIVVASVFIINLAIFIPKAVHVTSIRPHDWITWLGTALQEKKKLHELSRVVKVTTVAKAGRNADWLLDYELGISEVRCCNLSGWPIVHYLTIILWIHNLQHNSKFRNK